MKLKKKTRKKLYTLVASLVLFAVVFLLYHFGILDTLLGDTTTTTTLAVPPAEGTIEIHMIDVGQADAILIDSGDGYMLIDAADRTNASKGALDDYLEALGITTLEWLVLTHPDADHIGGAQMILEEYVVENVLLSDRTHSSATYTNMLQAILEEEGVSIHIVETDDTLDTDTDDITAALYRPGDAFLWDGIGFTVLGPFSAEDNNNSSVVLRMQYGDATALFTGDAEEDEEEEILEHISADLLNVDLLKAGHHGSETSTTDAFLAAVSPTVALISCGEGNEYGHPHSATLNKLQAAGVTVYRTDLAGDVVMVCDGVSFTLKPSN